MTLEADKYILDYESYLTAHVYNTSKPSKKEGSMWGCLIPEGAQKKLQVKAIRLMCPHRIEHLLSNIHGITDKPQFIKTSIEYFLVRQPSEQASECLVELLCSGYQKENITSDTLTVNVHLEWIPYFRKQECRWALELVGDNNAFKIMADLDAAIENYHEKVESDEERAKVLELVMKFKENLEKLPFKESDLIGYFTPKLKAAGNWTRQKIVMSYDILWLLDNKFRSNPTVWCNTACTGENKADPGVWERLLFLLAAQYTNLAVLESMLAEDSFEIDINTRSQEDGDLYGVTALSCLCYEYCQPGSNDDQARQARLLEIIRTLIAQGADPNLGGRYGNAAYFAITYGEEELWNVLCQSDFTLVFSQHTDINVLGQDRCSLLLKAIEKGFWPAISYISDISDHPSCRSHDLI